MPEDYRPHKVVASDRAGETKLDLQLFKKLQLRSYPSSPLVKLDRIRNQFVNLHITQVAVGLVQDLDSHTDVFIPETVARDDPMG